MAVGPWGRTIKGDLRANMAGMAPTVSYSHSRGIFGGMIYIKTPAANPSIYRYTLSLVIHSEPVDFFLERYHTTSLPRPSGISLEGSYLGVRDTVNCNFYGEGITSEQILMGEVEAPPAAQPLYDALSELYAR